MEFISVKVSNENIINLDQNLLRNFIWLRVYNVEINTSYAKFINDEFELFLILIKNTLFGKLDVNLNDFDRSNFDSIFNFFNKIQNKSYSINSIEKLLDEIDQIVLNDEFRNVDTIADENLIEEDLYYFFNTRHCLHLVEKIVYLETM